MAHVGVEGALAELDLAELAKIARTKTFTKGEHGAVSAATLGGLTAASAAVDDDDDGVSVVESVASTARTKGGSKIDRAAAARERVKQELKKGRQPVGRSSRNEAKDREKRKMLAGMKKDASGTSGW